MRILDLDLDFFLTGPCELASPGCRPDKCEAASWSEERMREFLEAQCGLSARSPLPGLVFPTHDRALDFWAAHAVKPFHVTHVDTHSDLGIGKPGPAFVLESVITRLPEERVTICEYRKSQKLDEANYLLFALAFRWISSLDNVRNINSRPDMPAFCGAESIRLTSSVGRLIPALDRREPVIPYHVYNDPASFRADAPYDLVSLAVSPRYTPASADFLVDVFREYIVRP